jgi:hypothetical protein
MSKITWQFQATIPGGPSVLLNQPSIDFAAYDVVSLTIPAGASNVAMAVQPASGAGDVVFLVVNSSQYDPKLTYTVDAIGTSHALDGPHVFVGAGAVSLLNNTASPQKLTFNNTLTADVTVQVITGRKA